MDSLSDEIWDVVIAGTSIPQSLLALSLSRSDKKILHLDRKGYYGGHDAGLSLQDAQDWAEDLRRLPSSVFDEALISEPDDDTSAQTVASLGPSRSYTLSLNPQIIYAQSEFLPSLVSSRIHTQLEFLAVGSWWVLRGQDLRKIPSTREDVFNDETLSMKDKRGLMKFLRFVMQEEGENASSGEDASTSFQAALSSKFKIPDSLQAPLLALALSPVAADSITLEKAASRIRRHMRSMGYFGQGFGAVIAKYGGNSEIAQVACRAGAVGGAVYLLGHELKAVSKPTSDDESSAPLLVHSTLADGTQIRSRYVVGEEDDIPSSDNVSHDRILSTHTWRSITIVGNPLQSLFPPTSDNGLNPAVAMVLVDDTSTQPEKSPIYLQIHSEDTGECPAGQCVIYTSLTTEDSTSRQRLEAGVKTFLDALDVATPILWTLSYRVSAPAMTLAEDHTVPALQTQCSPIVTLPPRSFDLAFNDETLKTVKAAWELIMQEQAAESSFLRFEERESEIED